MITVNKYVFEDLRGIIGGFLALLGSWSVGLMALVTNILVCVVNFLLAELPLDGSLPQYKSSSRSWFCGGRDNIVSLPVFGDDPLHFSHSSIDSFSSFEHKWRVFLHHSIKSSSLLNRKFIRQLLEKSWWFYYDFIIIILSFVFFIYRNHWHQFSNILSQHSNTVTIQI